ncbi:MAG TPA: TIGR00303 family protein [Candidatus Nitrosocosmicus sp.]
MMDFLNIVQSKNIIDINDFKTDKSIFLLAMSNTETAKIPGLTVAGANTELIKYTPAADAEYIQFGRCKSIDAIPATPDGKPTPALITKTALELANIPMLAIDAGAIVKPKIPHFNINSPSGKNIAIERALDIKDVISNYEMGKMIGTHISRKDDLIVIGESIPGGTTTALGVLSVLGINAFNKVSSSMSNNPHELKNNIIKKSLVRNSIKIGEYHNDPFNAISYMGDPMMPTICGLVEEIIYNNKKIILAGGTQMCAIVALLKALKIKLNNKLCIGTTSYVINDKSSNLIDLMNQISYDVPILYADLGLQNSKKNGLKAYSDGFVKEGAGAGGATIAAKLKNDEITSNSFLKKIDEKYQETIENPMIMKKEEIK